jgi:protein-S-isoprenylcysteine O-methyltransferase Ste14
MAGRVAEEVYSHFAVFSRSLLLVGYIVLFVVATHAFVVREKEPTLVRRIVDEYQASAPRRAEA